jgi:aldehyde dehydrogenase (NAD+)
MNPSRSPSPSARPALVYPVDPTGGPDATAHVTHAALDAQKAAFLRDGPPTLKQRKELLLKLKAAILARLPEIERALSEDFGHRSPHETALMEVLSVIQGINYQCRNLRRWMRRERRHVPMTFQPASAWVSYQPLGVVGIMSPWNYPVALALMPLATAIAAGNRAMIKPSEFTPASSALVVELVSATFTPEQALVVTGDAAVGQHFASLPFDHLVFTGSTAVGRAVMKAASENLVPVTLELGGKSPVIVDRSANLDEAARKIAWGKFFNSGQICIAPDYVLAEAPIRDQLVDEIQKALTGFEAENASGGKRIVNERHFNRLTAALAATQGQVAIGGGSDSSKLNIQPTVVVDPAVDEPLMTDEIFGPILPVLTVQNLDEAIAFVNSRPKPLAAYLFTKAKAVRERVIKEVPAGGMVVNHLLFHFATHKLPFGGVGPSGLGAYHGKFGFEEFSHRKSVLTKPTRPDLASFIYPPYTEKAMKLARRLF